MTIDQVTPGMIASVRSGKGPLDMSAKFPEVCTVEDYAFIREVAQSPSLSRQVYERQVRQGPSVQEFVAGYIHDELGGRLKGLENAELLLSSCKNDFYRDRMPSSTWPNVYLVNRIFMSVCSGCADYAFRQDLTCDLIFNNKTLFGNAMADGFAPLRQAGADERLINKGKEFVSLRFTIGNFIPLPMTKTDGTYLKKVWKEDYTDRFDLLLDEIVAKMAKPDESALSHLIKAADWYFGDNADAFVDRFYLEDIRTSAVNRVTRFTKTDLHKDSVAYLACAEQYLDFAIASIRARSRRIIVALGERLSVMPEALCPSNVDGHKDGDE